MMMAYIMFSQDRLTKEWQRLLGYPIILAVGSALVWASGRVRRRILPSERMREFGSAKGEFSVPDDFNDPLPKDIEDEFYK